MRKLTFRLFFFALILIGASGQFAKSQTLQELQVDTGSNGAENTIGINSSGAIFAASKGQLAVIWSQASGFTYIGILPGALHSFANGISANGTAVTGYTTNNGAANPTTGYFGEAYIWTQATGMVGLGVLPGGLSSYGNAISSNGEFVVGYSTIGNIGTAFARAFRWSQSTGMENLGVLPGASNSIGYGVNQDGTVVVGSSFVTGSGDHAFRWTPSGGMIDLGVGRATAVSSDGTIVVGNNPDFAFRWTQSTGKVILPTLPGASFSSATAISADGQVIVGYSQSTSVPTGDAVRWTSSNGVQSIKDLLTAAGVNITGWSLTIAKGTNSDGSVIAGYGKNPSSNDTGWIARLTASGTGLITPENVSESFSALGAVNRLSSAFVRNVMTTMSQQAIQSPDSTSSHKSRVSMFGYGAYDSDPLAFGLIGATVSLVDSYVAGFSVSGGTLWSRLPYTGFVRMNGGALSSFISRSPEHGFQMVVGAAGAVLFDDIERGYLNGVSPVTSRGNTRTMSLGLTARLGWTFTDPLPNTRLTPFVTYTYATSRTNEYTESTGPMPSQINKFNADYSLVHSGFDVRYVLGRGSWAWGTLAYVSRLSGTLDNISGNVIGVLSVSGSVPVGALNWLESTIGVRREMPANFAILSSLTISTAPHFSTTYQARIGVTKSF